MGKKKSAADRPTSFRIDHDTKVLIDRVACKLEVNQKRVVVLGVRLLAEREGIS